MVSCIFYLLVAGLTTRFWMSRAKAHSDAIAVEVHTKYAQIKVPSTSPLLILISESSQSFDSAVHLWSEFVRPGDVVFDINSGYGGSFFPLAKLVGETGNVIGFESDDDYFELLYDFMTEHSTLSQYCALIKSALFERVNSVKDLVEEVRTDDNISYMSLATIFRLYRPSCPKMIRINEVVSRPSSTLMLLVGDRAVLRQCRPVIYLDNNFVEYSAAIIKTLEELDYALYWHTSWAIDPVTYDRLNQQRPTGQSLPTNTYSINIIGMPAEMLSEVDEGVSSLSHRELQLRHKLVPYSKNKYYICEYLYDKGMGMRGVQTHGNVSHCCYCSGGIKQRIPIPNIGAVAESGGGGGGGVIERGIGSFPSSIVQFHAKDLSHPLSSLIRMYGEYIQHARQHQGGTNRVDQSNNTAMLSSLYEQPGEPDRLAFTTVFEPSIVSIGQMHAAELSCLYWAEHLNQDHKFRAWLLNITSVESYQSYYKSWWDNEVISLGRNCIDFVRKRFQMLNDLLLAKELPVTEPTAAQRSDEHIHHIDGVYQTFYRNNSDIYTRQDYAHHVIVSTLSNNIENAEVSRDRKDLGRESGQMPAEDNISLNMLDHLLAHPPFQFRPDEEAVGDPIWGTYGSSLQNRIRAWQYPDENHRNARMKENQAADGKNAVPLEIGTTTVSAFKHRTCSNSKYLVFQPPSDRHGIGSMVNIIAGAFRYAICMNRILVLEMINEDYTMAKWKHPGCIGNTFECYFESVHGCASTLTRQEIESAPRSDMGQHFDVYPYTEAKVLVLHGHYMHGKCRYCYDSWPTDIQFFNGLPNLNSYHAGVTPHEYFSHWSSVTSAIKLLWQPQFVRFLLRPRSWFATALHQLVANSLYSPVSHGSYNNSDILGMSTPRSKPNPLPSLYLSLHVRFGMKVEEVDLQPLNSYMKMARKKLPHIKDIFVSTETDAVIHSLIEDYPQYRFHFLRYHRSLYLDFRDVSGETSDFVHEFMYSFANLLVASEAQGFIGTLSSNWCGLIFQMERTRGDGGFEYLSLDKGSAYTTCF